MPEGTIPSSSSGELRALLGPLVSPLLRQQDGALDLAKVPSASLEVFREFLLTQLKTDGLVFNEHLLDSYHQVLGKTEYLPLLAGLYVEGKGKKPNFGTHYAKLLKRFTSELIDVSAQNFVTVHINHEEGRARIRSALFDKDHFNSDTRSDLAKAIAHVGYQKGGSWRTFQRFNRKIPVMDYWNLTVNEKDIDAASFIADEILEDVGHHETLSHALNQKYLKDPGKVVRYAGLERELGRKITDEQILKHAKIASERSVHLDPATQLTAKLARFWLMVVDEDHWRESNAFKTGTNGAFLLRRTETLLKSGERLQGESEFLDWSKAVRDFIQGGLKGDGFFASTTVVEMMAGVPQFHRAAYDDLNQFVDEIHYAHEMGERVFIEPETGVEEVRSQFLQGLHQAKRSLWYSYKQHNALSRGISQIASLFNSGDTVEIKAGQGALDQLIKQVQEAKNPSAIEAAVKTLQDQLKETGELNLAMRAAEMEGMEQLLGLGQTILILLATRGFMKGVQGIGAARPAVGPLAMGAREGAIRIGKTYALGNYLSAAENAVASATEQVRPGGEHWKNWAKDSTATGLSMMVTAPFPLLGDKFNSGGIIRDMFRRYGTGGLAAAGRLGGDTVAEISEEWLDAFFRARMDDSQAVIGFDQARELAMVSAFGGAKMGIVKEMLKKSVGVGGSDNPSAASASRDSESDPPPAIGPMRQIQNLAEAYGSQNPLIHYAPFIFPLTHPERIRSQLESSLRKSLLGPLEEISKDKGVSSVESLWRNSAYRSLMFGIKVLYPVYWVTTVPFKIANYPEYRAKQKILAEYEKRREAFATQVTPNETDYEELLARPNLSFQATVHWTDYQKMAKTMGWDPHLVMARGLKDSHQDEVEVILEQAFGTDLDAKVAFLSRYPLRGGVQILRREIAQFQPGQVSQEGFPIYFNIAEVLEGMGRKSRTAMDMKVQPGVHPQVLVAVAESADLNDWIRLRSLQMTLRFLQDRMAPEEAWIPRMDWFENPRLKASVIRLWGETGRQDYLPEVLAALKNEKDPEVVRAAAYTVAKWKSWNAVAALQHLEMSSKAPLARVAARRALGHIKENFDLDDELQEWLGEGSLATFNADNELIWSEMGGRSLKEWFDLPERPEKVARFGKNRSQIQRQKFATSLLAVSQDYLDKDLHRSQLTEYQIVGVRILLDILLDGTGPVRKAALEALMEIPERPMKRLLQSWQAKDWTDPQKAKLEGVFNYISDYIAESKNPTEHRTALLGLIWERKSPDELRALLNPLLANPATAPVAARALDESSPGWDSYIQDERHRRMTPDNPVSD